LACTGKCRPGAARVLRGLLNCALVKPSKAMKLKGPHDLLILPNDEWDKCQTPWLSSTASYGLVQYSQGVRSKPEYETYMELERFIRHLIFEDARWRPASFTSVIITFALKDGIRHRFWVNGNLIGMRDYINLDEHDPHGDLRETCLMVKQHPQFESIIELEEYVRSRLPYANQTTQEIQCLTEQIEKRFSIVGKVDVPEFSLRRKAKRDRIVFLLRWDIPRESWGFTSWKAYFELGPYQNVKFLSSRVSCHVYLNSWFQNELPPPWTFEIFPRRVPPLYRLNITKRALTWLQICNDLTLKKTGVILSFEDDPITGMPEDIPDGVSMDMLRQGFDLRPPEPIGGINRVTKADSIDNGLPCGLFLGWRLVPSEASQIILEILSQITIDPNIIPPEVPIAGNCPTGCPRTYRPRIPPRSSDSKSSMMLVMLRDFGYNALKSGFIMKEGEKVDKIKTDPYGIILARKPVLFKNSRAVVDPADLERFVVLDVVKPRVTI
jgi:hypothetical protein